MAIGDVPVPRNSRVATQTPNAPSGTFGEGTARALGQLGAAIGGAGEDIEAVGLAFQRRQERQEDFETQRRWVEYSGEQDRVQAERIQQAAADGTYNGVHQRVNEEIEQSNAAFLETIPERLRGEYSVRLERLTNSKVTGAFNWEYAQGNKAFVQETEQTVDNLSVQMQQGSVSADQAIAAVEELIEKSDLPDIARQELRVQALTRFRSIEFQNEIQIARAGGGTVGPATGADVVAAGLLPHERGFLNAVSRRESGDKYNVRYNGHDNAPATFDDFSDHPRVFVKRPDGRMSSAAGRYQFTATTWDQVSRELGLTSFSPENQDRAAIHLARKRYNAQRAGGLTFDQALQSGNREIILTVKQSLGETWEAFSSMSNDEFVNIVTGSKGIAGGGTGSALYPDLWNDPRYAELPYEELVKLANAGATAHQKDLEDQAAAAKDAADAALQGAYMGAIRGQLTEADVDRLLDDGTLRTASEVRSFEEFARRGAEQVDGATRVQQQLVNDDYVFTGRDMKDMNAFIGEDGLAALSQRNEEYARGGLVPFVARTGMIPTNSARVLSQQLSSTDPMHNQFALGVLGDIYSQNPAAIERAEGLTRGQKDQIAVFSANRAFTTPAEAMELYRASLDPNMGQQLEVLSKEGEKAFADISDRQLLNAFDPSIFVGGPDMPASPAQTIAFRNNARALYVQGYKLFAGDDGKATDYMNERLKLEWGQTEIGGAGKRLARLGPEKYYEQVDGGWDWIDFNVRAELELGEDVEFQLVGDAQTKFEGSLFASGGSELNASYMVAVKDDEGRWRLQLADNGQPRRLAFEITDTQQEIVFGKAEAANLNTRLGQLQTQLGNSTDPAEQFQLEQEIIRLGQQRNALHENAKVITGVDTPEQQISSLQKMQSENERALINAEWRLNVARGQGNATVIQQLETEVELLRTQAENLQRRLGDTDG